MKNREPINTWPMINPRLKNTGFVFRLPNTFRIGRNVSNQNRSVLAMIDNSALKNKADLSICLDIPS